MIAEAFTPWIRRIAIVLFNGGTRDQTHKENPTPAEHVWAGITEKVFREERIQLNQLPQHHQTEQGESAADERWFAFDLNILMFQSQLSLKHEKNLMENIDIICKVEPKLQIIYICSIRILSINLTKRTQLIGDHDFGVNCNMHRFNFRDFESMSENVES